VQPDNACTLETAENIDCGLVIAHSRADGPHRVEFIFTEERRDDGIRASHADLQIFLGCSQPKKLGVLPLLDKPAPL